MKWQDIIMIAGFGIAAYLLYQNFTGKNLLGSNPVVGLLSANANRNAAAALDTGANAGQVVSIVDNPDPMDAFSQWIGEVTTNTGLQW